MTICVHVSVVSVGLENFGYDYELGLYTAHGIITINYLRYTGKLGTSAVTPGIVSRGG